MSGRATVALVLVLVAAGALVGCSNPDSPGASSTATSRPAPANAGEPSAPPPASPASQAPFGVQPSTQRALADYAHRYTNWTYRSLTEDQRALARSSVGAARLAEQQASARSRNDAAIARGQVWNRGQTISINRDLAAPGMWVVVTREQTGGNTEYEGLPASYHVTLAKLAAVPGGYAVGQWLPQS
jgi:hypothetical protein